MPHIFTHGKYADNIFMYWTYDGNSTAVIEECRRQYPHNRTANIGVFARVYQCLWTTSTLPNIDVSYDRERQMTHRKRWTILDAVQRIPTSSTHRLTRRVYKGWFISLRRTLNDEYVSISNATSACTRGWRLQQQDDVLWVD